MWVSKKRIEAIQFQINGMMSAMTALGTLSDKIDKYNMAVVENNNRIKSLEIDFRDFLTDFKKSVYPMYSVESTKFVPQDKKLFIEEKKEFTNLYK